MGDLKNNIKTVIDNILNTAKEETKKTQYDNIQAIKEYIELSNLDYFSLFVKHEFSNMLDILLSNTYPNLPDKNIYKMAIIILEYKLFERNILNLIIKYEGTCCSVDKSRWLIRAYFKYLINNEKINMDIGEKCYWKPKFGKSDQWIELMDSIIDLYYGKPNRFIKIFSIMNNLEKK